MGLPSLGSSALVPCPLGVPVPSPRRCGCAFVLFRCLCSADLNAGWLSPTGYYWIPEASGHTSFGASGGGPCKHATSGALAADLTRTWVVAISGTVPD